MNTVGVTDYTNQTPLSILDEKYLISTPLKDKNIIIKCAQKRRCHLQCMNDQYAKF